MSESGRVTDILKMQLSLSEGFSLPLVLVLFNFCFANKFFTYSHTFMLEGSDIFL